MGADFVDRMALMEWQLKNIKKKLMRLWRRRDENNINIVNENEEVEKKRKSEWKLPAIWFYANSSPIFSKWAKKSEVQTNAKFRLKWNSPHARTHNVVCFWTQVNVICSFWRILQLLYKVAASNKLYTFNNIANFFRHTHTHNLYASIFPPQLNTEKKSNNNIKCTYV